MADKNKNDILEEQRKARQEFLELKKMQHGEIPAPPKPSETSVLPKTPKEKWNNFWYQYKWYVVAITAIVAVLSVLTVQCATRTKYDLEVVYFTYNAVLDEQTAAVADYIKQYAKDINGDGEVNVQVINCSYSKASGDTQYQYTMMSKLQAIIAGDQNALLFITDEASYKYLNEISKDTDIFEDEPYIFGEAFYNATESKRLGKLPDGLRISCRKVSDTVLESKKNIEASYKNSKSVLEAIKGGTEKDSSIQ